jgi:hypothetical protein
MKNITNYLFLFFILITAASNAQDLIKTESEVIQAKVIEIGLYEIRYRDFNNPDGPIIVIEKDKVHEITYENGTKYLVKADPYEVNKEVEVRGKTHSIKFELFSPTTNDIVFGYERMLKVGTNLEFKIGYIGMGNKNYSGNPSGVSFKAGLKFLTSPQYIVNGMKYVHPLKGKYIKPELIFNSYSENVEYSTTISPYTHGFDKIQKSNIAFAINFGTQQILGNIMTLDYYIGIGYGFRITGGEQSNSYTIYSDADSEYAYSHFYFGPNSSIIMTGGFTIGGLF